MEVQDSSRVTRHASRTFMNIKKAIIAGLFLFFIIILFIDTPLPINSLSIKMKAPSLEYYNSVKYGVQIICTCKDKYKTIRPSIWKKVEDDYVYIKFDLPNKEFTSLRIDPGRVEGDIFVKSVSLNTIFEKSLYRWSGKGLAEDFEPRKDIDEFKEQEGNLYIKASGGDPYFVSIISGKTIFNEAKKRGNIIFKSLIFILLLILSAVIFIADFNKILDFKITGEKFALTLWPALFFSSTLFFFTPGYLYFTNSLEFTCVYYEIVPYLSAIAFVCFLILTIAILFLKGKIHEKTVCLIFIMSFLFWLQGNVLLWNYGPLDGKDINWGSLYIYGIIDGVIWILFISLALVKSSSLYKGIINASMAFILIQIISLIFISGQVREAPSFKRYSVSEEEKFVFSQAENVIILILDNFQSDYFYELIQEEPRYREVFEGFTYFRNSTGGFPKTYASIALLLTGNFYDNSIPIQNFLKESFTSESSIPKVLKQEGYKVELYPHPNRTIYLHKDIASNVINRVNSFDDLLTQTGLLVRLSFFRSFPHFFKRPLYERFLYFLLRFSPDKTLAHNPVFGESGKVKDRENIFPREALGLHDVKFICRILSDSEVKEKMPLFKFYHLNGAHTPFILDENFEVHKKKDTYENYRKQAKASVKMTEMFLNKLKELGIYDNSLIIVMGDHGAGYRVSEKALESLKEDTGIEINNNEDEVSGKVIGSALPLLLVKPFKEKGDLEISDSPVSTADIPETVFSLLGIERENAFSFFHISPEEKGIRDYNYYSFDSWTNDYLPTLTSYEICGHSWNGSSWKKKDIKAGLPELSSIKKSAHSTLFAVETINDIKIKDEDIIKVQGESLTVKGWAVDKPNEEKAGGVYIDIDENLYPAYYGIIRRDLLGTLNFATSTSYGFTCTIDTEELGKGRHILTIKILTNDRKSYYSSKEEIIFDIL